MRRLPWRLRWKYLWLVPALSLAPFILGFGSIVHYIYFDRSDLPALEPFVRFELPTIGRVYDANGAVLFELAHEYRRIITYDEIPPVVRNALISTEDKNFFNHSGVDYRVFPRVLWRNLARFAGGGAGAPRSGSPSAGFSFSQGGSTITQQLVRDYFLKHLRTRESGATLVSESLLARMAAGLIGGPCTNKLLRKMEEIRLSIWLEQEMESRYGSRRKAKEEILARYASILYMGNGRYGFATASEYYFGAPLSSYTIEDADKAALLAGIMKCPRDYAPQTANLERAVRRRNEILGLMSRNNHLTVEQARRAQMAPVRLAEHSASKTSAPAVIETLFSEMKRLDRDELRIEQLAQGRIIVHSTARAEIQQIANTALENGLREFEARHPKATGVIQGSVVVLSNSDAEILAVTGGRQTYRDRASSYVDYNRASGSSRQPGSAMKPFVYLAAFDAGASLDHEVPDEPISVMSGDAQVKWIRNYDGEFKGIIPVRQALAESRNAAATWIAQGVGMPEVVRVARELGITSELRSYISTALGASEVRLMELANAYRAMASGISAEPHAIQRVTDAAGSLLFSADAAARPLRIQHDALREIQEGLRGVIRLPDGTAHSLDTSDFPIPVMGKTGTSSDYRDALFVGSTYGPDGITVAVRVGYDDNRGLGEKETGARAALPIFKEIMLQVYGRQLTARAHPFPAEMEDRITEYIACAAEATATSDLEAATSDSGDDLMVAHLGPFTDQDLAGERHATMTRCAPRGLALAAPAYEDEFLEPRGLTLAVGSPGAGALPR